MSRRSLWLSAAALVALTLTAHWPALQNGFIWDDDDHLTQNPAVAAPDGLRQIWSSLRKARYYPLTLTTFWLERQVWGLKPLPYHTVNLLLHAANAVLVFLLLRRLLVPGAWAAAALWALHPLNVESVVWITELKNTQSSLFFFLTLLAFLRYEDERKLGWYALALATFAAALLSKPSTVPLPALLLLYGWWRHGRLRGADVLRSLPFFALSLGMATLTIAEQQLTVHLEASNEWHLPFLERALVAGRALWFYLGKTLWPSPLSFIYPRWRLPLDWFPLAAALGAAIGLVVLSRRTWARAGILGLGYFVLMLSPVLGFLNVYFFRYSFVADHFAYLASLGPIALAVAAVCAYVPQQTVKFSAAAAALGCLAALSWQRAAVFRSDEALWRDTLDKNPAAAIAHNNLGNIEQHAGHFRAAESHYRRALALEPDYPKVHNNLGITLAQLGQRTEAAQEFEIALKLQPAYIEARENLVRLLAEDGRDDDAIAHLRTLINLQPQNAIYYLQLGELLQRRGQRAQAIEAYRSGLRESPANLDLAHELARLLNP